MYSLRYNDDVTVFDLLILYKSAKLFYLNFHPFKKISIFIYATLKQPMNLPLLLTRNKLYNTGKSFYKLKK